RHQKEDEDHSSEHEIATSLVWVSRDQSSPGSLMRRLSEESLSAGCGLGRVGLGRGLAGAASAGSGMRASGGAGGRASRGGGGGGGGRGGRGGRARVGQPGGRRGRARVGGRRGRRRFLAAVAQQQRYEPPRQGCHCDTARKESSTTPRPAALSESNLAARGRA